MDLHRTMIIKKFNLQLILHLQMKGVFNGYNDSNTIMIFISCIRTNVIYIIKWFLIHDYQEILTKIKWLARKHLVIVLKYQIAHPQFIIMLIL